MKNLKTFIFKTITLSIFILCLSATIISAQENSEMQLYNRNEKVQLSKSLIHKNDDYYISVDDLSKINIQYKFEENDKGFYFNLFSEDAFGTENILRINVTVEELHKWDDSVGGFISIPSCSFSNVMKSKKFILLNSNGMQVNTINIGDFESVVIEEDVYYISLKAISLAISYEYIVDDDIIKLWVTNTEHVVINGDISLPEGDVAPEGGLNVDILILKDEKELTDKHSLKAVCIPPNENKLYYFIETDIISTYSWIMFEFDGNYQTINEFINISNGSLLNISTNNTEKIDFKVTLHMPNGMMANDDIYATMIFQRCSVYNSLKPIIKKGEVSGTITLNIDKDFAGKVAFSNVSGDDRIFDYGYYSRAYRRTRILSDYSDHVFADYKAIELYIIQGYDISGTVIPTDINSGYKVRIFGVTDAQEKIHLHKDVGEDFKFSIKVPASIPEYTLSVAYKPGAYCGYISDGVSDYSGKYHTFENVCDYSDIELKYEPFLPDLPIDMNVYVNTGRAKLKNISDELVKDFTLYCAHYREGRLLYLSSIPIDNLMVYSDYESYKFEYPTEFYKTDEVKIFAWDCNLKPLSVLITKKVNEPYYPDDMEFEDADRASVYYTAIKDMHNSGVMLGDEDGLFHPDNYVMRNEASAMFCRLLGYWCTTYKFSCDDVPRENWESSYVGICVNENIFELTNNKFRPYENITVSETYEAIENILEKQNCQVKTTDLFMNINSENLERDITRAEFAQMLYNYKNCINK